MTGRRKLIIAALVLYVAPAVVVVTLNLSGFDRSNPPVPVPVPTCFWAGGDEYVCAGDDQAQRDLDAERAAIAERHWQEDLDTAIAERLAGR